MFKNAIRNVAKFTRPIHSVVRLYGSNKLIPASATLFFVNDEGYAITCKHVIHVLAESMRKNDDYKKFWLERTDLMPDDALRELEKKYKYQEGAIIQQLYNFIGCVEGMESFTWHLHPHHDLAILKFNNFKKKLYQGHAIFKKDANAIGQGDFLCRLGFPFPEFSNFNLDTEKDQIIWTQNGNAQSPIFPQEGMLTRFLKDEKSIFGIELSTPGLRGQSGGPLFDQNGIVCGMQFSTKHLHLGFDMEEKEILVNTKSKKVTDYAFIHLGQCIHYEVIKDFLREKQVAFFEE